MYFDTCNSLETCIRSILSFDKGRLSEMPFTQHKQKANAWLYATLRILTTPLTIHLDTYSLESKRVRTTTDDTTATMLTAYPYRVSRPAPIILQPARFGPDPRPFPFQSSTDMVSHVSVRLLRVF